MLTETKTSCALCILGNDGLCGWPLEAPFHTSQTYTNMASGQTRKMLALSRCVIYLLILLIPGSISSTLRLHHDQRFMLPQDRGFSLVRAHLEHAESRVVRLEREVRDASAAHQHRARRNAAGSPVPKVYGRVSEVYVLLFCQLHGCDNGFCLLQFWINQI